MTGMAANVEIRPCRSSEIRNCVSIEQAVWGAGTSETLGVDELEAACREGGILLGAWVGREPAGFVFSYRVQAGGETLQHSHLLAILPAFRGRGIAHALKVAQYEIARQQQDRWVVWTFDPLEAVNAHLNIGRLGATCRRYFVDFYGSTGSPLHAGLETDRLLAEWRVAEPWVPRTTAPAGNPTPAAIPVISGPKGRLRPGAADLGLSETRITLPIPSQIQELKKEDPGLAKAWQRETRAAFLHYLSQGYSVTGFALHRPGRGGNLPAFVLASGTPANLLVDGLDFSGVPFRSRELSERRGGAGRRGNGSVGS